MPTVKRSAIIFGTLNKLMALEMHAGVPSVQTLFQIFDVALGIAVLHSMANLGVELADGPLKAFMEKTKDMDADKRGLELLSAADIQKQADNTANDSEINQTDAPGR